MSHCVAISPFKIIFTGGSGSEPFSRRITMFDTNTKIWSNEGELIHGRWGHASFLFNDKVIVTGGQNDTEVLGSTEILTFEQHNEGGSLNEPRWGHGIGVIDVKGEQRLVVFGGCSVDSPFDSSDNMLTSIEAWNEKEECWEITDLKMPKVEGLSLFSYCSKRKWYRDQ